jgi:hypothetical protein
VTTLGRTVASLLAENPNSRPSQAPKPDPQQSTTPPYRPDKSIIDYEKKDVRPSDLEQR